MAKVQDSVLFHNFWAVEPEEYAIVCNNPDPDKTLVVALTTYETVFHPSSLCVFI